MFRVGRTQSRTHPDIRATRLYGAPRYLWPLLISAWVQQATLACAGDKTRFKASLALYLMRGRLYEYLAERQTGVFGRMLHP
jgi:hypothetical protein